MIAAHYWHSTLPSYVNGGFFFVHGKCRHVYVVSCGIDSSADEWYKKLEQITALEKLNKTVKFGNGSSNTDTKWWSIATRKEALHVEWNCEGVPNYGRASRMTVLVNWVWCSTRLWLVIWLKKPWQSRRRTRTKPPPRDVIDNVVCSRRYETKTRVYW